jgi:hypothetical protein
MENKKCEHKRARAENFEKLDEKLEASPLFCRDCGEQIGYLVRDIQQIKPQIPKVRFFLNINSGRKAADYTLTAQ